MPRQGPECTMYFSGHQVHWIQVIGNGLPRNPRPGHLKEIQSQLLVVELDDGTHEFRNHSPRQIELAVSKWGSDVVVDVGRSLLKIPIPGTKSLKCFSIASADQPWRPCRYDKLQEKGIAGVAGWAVDPGGFSVPAGWLSEPPSNGREP